jgi:superfamily II DNA or RNA helicase
MSKTRKIYVYTTETYKAKNWYKIGETTQETVEQRVKQQDKTGNPEPLDLVDWWVSPEVSDKELHKSLQELGLEKIRNEREWFEIPGGVQDVKKAYHKITRNSARPNSFAMRKEQQECHDKCIASFEAGYDQFLFACVMRFGKTFTAYQAMKTLGYSNVLILTAKPEVCTSWREDLEQHVDFEGYNFIDLRTTPREEINFKQKNVFFSSFQYLEAESFVDKTWILDLGVDLVMVDEEHYGSKTNISGEILSHFETARQIHISGTPYKSWRAGLFDQANSYFYTYKDSQLGSNPGPRMNIYSLDVAQEVAKAQRAGGYTEEDGFHIAKLFAAADGEFENESYVEDLMMRVFDPAGHISKSVKLESPLRMKGVNKRNLDHVLVRVPSSVDSARALYNMLNRVLDDYEVILAAGQGGDAVTNVREVKNKIAANNKTVTITCGRFETGVTIPELGAVLLFDGGRSPESYNQMNFRASTPYKSEYWSKEDFYVFDFDPHRTLELVYVTSMMDKGSGQDMESVLGEFFEVAPVLVQAGVKFVQVKPSEVIDFYNTSISDMSTRFASEWGIRDCYDAKALAALSNISASGKKKIERIIADNPDLEKGKLRKLIVSSLASKSDKDEFKKTRQKLQAVLKRLPIAITVLGAVDLDSLLNGTSSIFQDITGVTTEEYEHFLEANIIDGDWQKDCIQHTSNKLLGIGQGSAAIWEVIDLYCNTKEASPGTPKFLADEMLDKLPQEIWSDKTKTFCDPAFANGSFYFLIIDRLMEGLSEVIEDSEERLKHIIENQVFIYDTNEVPRLFVRALAELEYNLKELNIKPNICYNNLLEEEINMKFDVVVMNAPYNKPVHEKGRKGGHGGRTLWDKFLVSAVQKWVKEDGYVCSINPPPWRKPAENGEVKELMNLITKENTLRFLNINSKKRGKEVFGASTRFDCIVVERSLPSPGVKTLIVDELGNKSNMSLDDKGWLPNYMFGEIEELLAKEGEPTVKVIYSRSKYGNDKPNISRKQEGAFIYPVVYGMRKDENVFLYSNTDEKGHFGVPKVILSLNERQHQPINDFDGNYATSELAFGIEIDSREDGDKLVEFVKSEGFQEIIKATKWSTFQTDWRMFTHFREGFWR